MTLRDILHSKPPIIVTIHKNKTVRDAVHIMSEKNVSGIFVVEDNDKLVSIFTERDIVRCTFNNISLDEKIENIMRHDITTFDPSVDISSAMNVASRKKIRHIPVAEGDRIVGMITFRDLVSYLLPEICYVAENIY
jgi:CBS domain-containing protein